MEEHLGDNFKTLQVLKDIPFCNFKVNVEHAAKPNFIITRNALTT